MHASLYLHWKKPDIQPDAITSRLGPSADITAAFESSFYANAPQLIPSAHYAHLLPEYVMILFPQGAQAFQAHVELRSAAGDLIALRERVRQVYVLLAETIKRCGSKVDELTVNIEAGSVISTGKLNSRMAVVWSTIRKTYLKDIFVGVATVCASYYLQPNFNLNALIGLAAAFIAMVANVADALSKRQPVLYEAE